MQGTSIQAEPQPAQNAKQLAYGKFYTALTLPTGLHLDHVTCRLQNGVLDIQVPIAEDSKPKQIQIQTGNTQKAISA